MPHKYCTRTKTACIPKMNYVYDNSNSDVCSSSSGSDCEYFDNSSDRGILCSNCNVGLGYFKDKPTLLAMAIKYLMETDGAT